MSINITIAVPLDVVAAIRESTSIENGANANTSIISQTSKAVYEAIKALPYDITPQPSSKRQRAEPTEDDSDDEIIIPLKQAKPEAPIILTEGPGLTVWLKDVTGRSYKCIIDVDAPLMNLACAYAGRKSLPVQLVRFVMAGRLLCISGPAEEEGVVDGSVLHTFLNCRGS